MTPETHEHDWFMAWDYCGSHSYVCRICSETMGDAEAEKRVREYPALKMQLTDARRARQKVEKEIPRIVASVCDGTWGDDPERWRFCETISPKILVDALLAALAQTKEKP